MKSITARCASAVLLSSAALFAGGAEAQVYNTSLQNLNGTIVAPGTPPGAGTFTTTTNAAGTRTTVTGSGPNNGANRAYGTPVLNSWYQTNIGYGSTVGITTDFADKNGGSGSAYFSQTISDNGKADLQYNIGSGGALAPVALSSLTSWAYDYVRGEASNNDPNQVTAFRFLMLKDGVDAGALIYERVYNAAGPVPEGTAWQTLSGDLATGNFWTNNGSLGPAFAAGAGSTKTLQEWIAGNSGSTLSVYGFQIGIGSGWQNSFFGGVDNVNVSFGAQTFNSNFEVLAVGDVPEPATWLSMIAGFGMIGGALRRRAAKAVLA